MELKIRDKGTHIKGCSCLNYLTLTFLTYSYRSHFFYQKFLCNPELNFSLNFNITVTLSGSQFKIRFCRAKFFNRFTIYSLIVTFYSTSHCHLLPIFFLLVTFYPSFNIFVIHFFRKIKNTSRLIE